MNLGENIHRLRTKHNMSQEELAGELNVSRQSVSKWENNSAVPELEKLLSMSRLFGVTLDELVESSSPSPRPKTEPEVPVPPKEPAPSEPKASPVLNRLQLLGGILILCALLLVVITWAVKDSDDALTALIAAIPIFLCGVACTVMKHPLVVCGWLGYIEYLFLFFVLSHRWEEETFGIILCVILALGMIALTVYQHKRGITVLPVWLRALGLSVLALLFILLLMNTLPPLEGQITQAVPGSRP